MGQAKEKPTVEEVLRLVEELTPEEREQVLLEMQKYQEELRQNIKIGLEQAERGELIDGDEAFRILRERNTAMRKKENP